MRKGFTLVEVIVVTVILAIIAAVTIPSVVAYRARADQAARNDTAHSLFLVSQNALTHLYSTGQEGSIEPDGVVKAEQITPALDSDELENNGSNIRYLRINKNDSSKMTNTLYELLDDYISNGDVLQQTILMEYNIKTGKVLSVFYSDTTESIGYGTSADYNAYQRSRSDRKNGEMGYWDVSSTGTDRESAIGKANIKLVDYTGGQDQGNEINDGKNYGLLTVECQLPKVYEAYNYTITLDPSKGSKQTVTVGKDSDSQYTWETIDDTLEEAIAEEDGTGLYVDTQNGSDGAVLVLVLDTARSGYSIQNRFSKIKCGNLAASVKVEFDGAVREEDSDVVHAYFGGESEDGAFQISSIRHLKNVALATTSEFVQTSDILCRDHNGDILLFDPIGVDKDTAFAGEYYGSSEGEAYTIYDLTIDDDSGNFTGLFRSVYTGGIVDGVTVAYTEEYWKTYGSAETGIQDRMFVNGRGNVGIIAGQNMGIITNCTVSGMVHARGASKSNQYYGAGGIAGRSGYGGSGEISGCSSAAAVVQHFSSNSDYPYYVGGIVGRNSGPLSYCEAGTAAGTVGQTGSLHYTDYLGQPYFGAASAAGSSRDGDYSQAGIQNDVMVVQGDHAGGIAGATTTSSKAAVKGDISFCVNAAKVTGTLDSGGIVGIIDRGATIASSYNAGTVENSGTSNGNVSAGGIAGKIDVTDAKNGSPVIVSCYNTANVTGRKYAGGLVGMTDNNVKLKTSRLRDSYSIGTITSRQGNGSRSAGVYGGNSNDNKIIIEDCAFLQNTSNTDQGHDGISMCSSWSQLVNITDRYQGFSPGMQSAGPFAYQGSCLDVKNEICDLGTNFHRTPWPMEKGQQ